MQRMFKVSLALAGIYGAIVIGMMAAVSHHFSKTMDGAQFSALISALALLSFQTLAILSLSLFALNDQRFSKKLLMALLASWHLGTWLFTYTVWAGLFALPLHFSKLAPLGGQLLLLSWFILGGLAFFGNKQ